MFICEIREEDGLERFELLRSSGVQSSRHLDLGPRRSPSACHLHSFGKDGCGSRLAEREAGVSVPFTVNLTVHTKATPL